MSTINITDLKTVPEQVYQNTLDIKDLKTDVVTAQTTAEGAETKADEAKTTADLAQETANTASETANSANTNANEAKTEAQTATGLANNAQTTADLAQETADKATTAVNQAWEKEFIDVTITPEDFDPSLIVTLTNEIYNLHNVITITASPDNGTTVNNNAKNIAYYQLRPLVQTTDGQIKLKASEIPAVNLYLKIQIEIQIEVI